jgi:hypothetical protein
VSAPFPATKPLQWEKWYSAGKNPLGEDVDRWQDPVEVMVIGWSVRTVLAQDGFHEVEDTDHVTLLVPPTFAWQAKDRADIPSRGPFLVEGVDDSNMGFHGWQPGLKLTMVRQEG